MSKLAELIAKNEGFGIPGAIPTVRNTPGDLRHSPHSSHEGIGLNDIGIIDTVEHGWQDLERQLGLYAQRDFTLLELVNVYLGFPRHAPLDASIVDGNNRVPYLMAICDGLSLSPDSLVSGALLVT